MIGCMRENDQDPPIRKNSTDEYRIERQEALANLDRVLSAIDGAKTKGVRRQVANMRIIQMPETSVLTRSGRSFPDSLLYAVNFLGDQGYAILAADRRIADHIMES